MIVCPECGSEHVFGDVRISDYQLGGELFWSVKLPYRCKNGHSFEA